MADLKANQVPTAVYYPIPLHCQPAFAGLGYAPGDFPVALALSQNIFSLPMHPYLEEADIQRVCDLIH
jgi:dTDP-4-amino-4,6-dideoxygalactose transaminase